MARRIELLGISHDILAAFVSRNNDLNGYWALGQLRNTMERHRTDRMVMTLTGKNHVQQDPECLGLSERFSTMLRKHVSSRQLEARLGAASTADRRDGCIRQDAVLATSGYRFGQII